MNREKVRECEQIAKKLMVALSDLQANESDEGLKRIFLDMATYSNQIRNRMYILLTTQKEGYK